MHGKHRRNLLLPFTASVALLIAFVVLLSFFASTPVHADEIVVLQLRVPFNGRFVRHDIWEAGNAARCRRDQRTVAEPG